jgi:hypothetical protein
VNETKGTYENVMQFIGIPTDDRKIFPIVNSSKVQRSKLVGILSASIPRWAYNAVRDFKHLAGLDHVHLNFIVQMNTKYEKKLPLSPKFKKVLIAEFESEIRLLEIQLDKDFNLWRT